MVQLADYLDAISPEERNAFHEGPNSIIAAKGRPFTDLGTSPGAAASSTYAPSRMTYAGPAPTAMVMPTATAPVDAGTWRATVSAAALALATTIANELRTFVYPSGTSLFVTPLRTFGLVVLDPSRMTVDNARATINGFATLLASSPFRGSIAARTGFDRIMAMVPRSPSATPITPTFTPGEGGIGPSSPGPTTPNPAGGGGSSTSGCPTNSTPTAPGVSPAGCMCNAGFTVDAAMTSCVPIAAGDTACSPGFRRASPGAPCTVIPPSTSSGSGMGWALLFGGALLAYRSLGK